MNFNTTKLICFCTAIFECCQLVNPLCVVHCYLDASWLSNVHINLPAVKRRSATLGARRTVKKQWQVWSYIYWNYFSMF